MIITRAVVIKVEGIVWQFFGLNFSSRIRTECSEFFFGGRPLLCAFTQTLHSPTLGCFCHEATSVLVVEGGSLFPEETYLNNLAHL